MSYIPQTQTISTAPQQLNTNDRAMWCLGWNECRDAMLTKPANLEINLSNSWRNRLLDGRTLDRDEEGFVLHPELPMTDEGTNNGLLFAALGIELIATEAEYDLSYEQYESNCETGKWHDWTPRPPKGDDWVLVHTFHAEDGPGAWWMRTKPVDYTSTHAKWIEYIRKACDAPAGCTMPELASHVHTLARRLKKAEAKGGAA